MGLDETVRRLPSDPAFQENYSKHWDERKAAFRVANDKIKARMGKRPASLRSRSAGVRWQEEKVRRILIKDSPGAVCLHCGSPDKLQVAHKVPRILGGTYELSNLMVLCQPCHLKHDHMASRPRAKDSRNYIVS